MATNTRNVRHLRINGFVVDMTAEKADRLAQPSPRVEKPNLHGSYLNEQELGNLFEHFDWQFCSTKKSFGRFKHLVSTW